MSWHGEQLFCFDVETTGVDVETDRIVQAAMIRVGGDRPTIHKTLVINPGVEIPEAASDVHGYTTERAKAEGVPAMGGVAAVCDQVQMAIVGGLTIVAFNARFDLTMLDRECRRHGHEPPDWTRARVVDPHVVDKWADRFRRGSRNLGATCAHYDVELGDAHDAGADALAAGRLAWRMARKSDLVQGRHPELIERRVFWKRVRDDIDLLHEAQAGWAREQAIGLRSYFEGKGRHEDAATVREDWPWIPYVEAVAA